MAHPYRVEDDATRGGRPRAELVYLSDARERHVGPARQAAQVGILGAVGCAVTASAGLPQLAVGVLLGSGVLAVWRWRRAPELGGIVFAVERGELLVAPRSTGEPILRARLIDLLDVILDTKSIRKVEPGRSVVPAVQFIDSKIGPEIDVARIVLQVANRADPIRLTDTFLPHMDAVEWVGKIRSFLRVEGWLPNDERETPASSVSGRPSEPDDA